MSDAIETAVKDDATAAQAAVAHEVTNLRARMLALESEAAGYVKAHVVYFMSAICLIVGAVGGYVIHK
jgi:hypothetical protein